MTPAQAIAVRALWRTLGEDGNILASSWSRLLADVELEALITLAGRFSAQLPKLYEDATELIVATGHILEAEGDRLIDLPYGAGRPPSHDGDPILDEIIEWEPPNAD